MIRRVLTILGYRVLLHNKMKFESTLNKWYGLKTDANDSLGVS